jgi:hypothetical protein
VCHLGWFAPSFLLEKHKHRKEEEEDSNEAVMTESIVNNKKQLLPTTFVVWQTHTLKNIYIVSAHFFLMITSPQLCDYVLTIVESFKKFQM